LGDGKKLQGVDRAPCASHTAGDPVEINRIRAKAGEFTISLSTTLFTASRVLSRWEEQGLVIAGREQVIIRNPHGLAGIIEDVAG
jgi:DNA-binding transcriptional regulator YiaG